MYFVSQAVRFTGYIGVLQRFELSAGVPRLRDMMTEEGNVFEVPLERRTVTVPVEMLSGSRTGLAIEREKRDFFDRYPILEYWLPGGMDASTVDMICAFMGWLDIVIKCPPHQGYKLEADLSQKNNVRHCIAWLWLNSEHLQIHVMHDIVREASLAFYKRVAWCLVYHPDLLVSKTRPS